MNGSRSAPGPADHRLEDAVAYHHDELEPAARAEFEEHLKICAGCREAVATSDVLFPNLAAALQTSVPMRTTDELLEIMDAAQRRIDAEKLERGETPSRTAALLRPRWHWRSKVLTLVAAAVVILLLASLALLLRHHDPGKEIYDPPKKDQRSP
jgi:predicted anti-sigma-YlaC factor YlaD